MAGECCRRRTHVPTAASYTAALPPEAVAKLADLPLVVRLLILDPVFRASACNGVHDQLRAHALGKAFQGTL